MSSEPALFTPIQVGESHLLNRVVFAPLTRFRATQNHTPSDLMVTYYVQRSATPSTLLISEATFVDHQAAGYDFVPGIWSDEQAAGWKKIVDGVHAKGCFIYLQLWNLGRAAGAESLKNEEGGPWGVVSASNLPFEGGATPRPLTLAEIKGYPDVYAHAAKNFIEKAGGDGVEVHCANGYLLDQFIQTNSNKRTDDYGGSLANRLRFPLEVIGAVVKAVGAKRVGVRISPYNNYQGMKMPLEEAKETFSTFVKAIKSAHPDFAYLHVVEGRALLGIALSGLPEVEAKPEEDLEYLHKIWTPSPFIVCGCYHTEDGLAKAESSKNTLVAYGRPFISNPDLPARIKAGIKFADYNKNFFYSMGPDKAEGYTSYPPASELTASA